MAYIESLRFKNWRQIKDLTIDFDRITIIAGDNDRGKSSIYKAIEFLFTGKLNGTLDDYINIAASGFSLQMKGHHNDNTFDYIVERDKATKRTLYWNKKRELNSAALSTWKSHFNPELTQYSSFVSQHNSINLLFEDPAKRRDNFKRLFNVDLMDGASKEAKEDAKKLKDKIESLEKQLLTLENITYEFQDVPEIVSISNVRKELELLNTRYEEWKKLDFAYQTYLKDKSNFEKSQIEINDLTNKINETRKEIESLESQRKEVIRFDNDTYYDLKNQLANIQSKKDAYEKEVKAYNEYVARKEDSESKIKEIESKIKSFTILKSYENIEDLQKDVDKYKETLSYLKAEEKILKEKFEAVKDGQCPVCHSEFHEGDIHGIEYELSKVASQKDEMETTLAEYKDRLSKAIKIKEENEKVTKEKDLLSSDLSNAKENLFSLSIIEEPEKLNFSRKEGQIKRSIEEMEKEREEIEKVNKSNKLIDEKITQINSNVLKFEAQKEMHLKVNEPSLVEDPGKFDDSRMKECERQIAINDEQILNAKRAEEFNERLREQKQNNDKEIDKIKQDIFEKERERQIIEESRQSIEKKIIPYTMKQGTGFVEEKMNEFFNEFAPDYLVHLNENLAFDFSKDNGNHWGNVDVYAGGFHKEVISMGYREAIGGIQYTGLKVLDEPDSAASWENSKKLFDYLIGSSELEQMVLITHNKWSIEHLENEYGAKVIWL